jgi:Uma2 family endonuclease
MGPPDIAVLTSEEYLIMERSTMEKHEFYHGEVFAMSGASLRHNKIFNNTFGSLYVKLSEKKCQPYGSYLRIHIPKNTLYTYPDISIICGEPETTDDVKDTVTNPTVIIEILSKGTRDYDKGQKFTLYRDIPTLMEYVLIDSESTRIEKFHRNPDNSWTLRDYQSMHDVLLLEPVEVELSIGELYRGVL